MLKIKDKEKFLKAAREKRLITYKSTLIRLTVGFLSETMKSRGSGKTYSKYWSGGWAE